MPAGTFAGAHEHLLGQILARGAYAKHCETVNDELPSVQRRRTRLTELRNRGLKDIFVACVDGLKGFPQAIETVFPKTMGQLCIVHMVRASLNYVNWKER